MDKVVWCWSLTDPNILFIFRETKQEIMINLTTLREKAVMQEGVLFFPEETELLQTLVKELKEIK